MDKRILHSLAWTLFVLALPAPGQPSQNWPQFRGHGARGVATGFATIDQWDVEKGTNIAWKAEIPGLAHSSPVVFGDRLFVTTVVRKKGRGKLSSLYGSKGYGAGESVADEGKHSYWLYCLDKRSGKVRWKEMLHEGVPKVKRHPKASHASATPACVRNRIVVSFGSEGVFCLDHDGKRIWKRDLGTLNVGAPGNSDKTGFQWGHASSPVIHGQRVFVQCDHEGPSFVAALDLEDGHDVWRVMRDENSTWCTPTVCSAGAGGRPQLILNGYKHIGGYDLETGKQVWKLVGGGDVPVPTPIVADGLIFLTSAHGRSRPIRAIKVSATGDLDPDPAKCEHLVWEHRRRGIYMQTPIVLGEHLYLCSDGGTITCYEAKTGERLYRERVGGGLTGFSGSPVIADGKIYLSGESGEVSVVRIGPKYELISTNDMGETCMAPPAVSEGTIYFRTRGHVVAVAKGSGK